MYNTENAIDYFYSDGKALSKYSPVMLHLSPATRILSENPENGKGMNCKLYYILILTKGK